MHNDDQKKEEPDISPVMRLLAVAIQIKDAQQKRGVNTDLPPVTEGDRRFAKYILGDY